MDQKSMTSLLEKGLRSIYEAEHQILAGLHLMTAQAFSPELQVAFRRHEKETRNQIKRLDEVAHNLLIDFKKDETSKVQKALGKGKEILMDIVHIGSSMARGDVIHSVIEETKATVERLHQAEPDLIDIALASGGQQIEQAEIASYQFLCHLAEKLDEPESLVLLEQNLQEEKRMLALLTDIADTELTLRPRKTHKKMAAGH